MTEAIVVALATKGADLVAAGLGNVWHGLVSLVRRRFSAEGSAVATLEAAQAEPADPVRLRALGGVLEQILRADPEFAGRLNALWARVPTQLTVDTVTAHSMFAGTVHGNVVHSDAVYLHDGERGRLPPPRQLPIDVANFTGRTSEIDDLDRLLNQTAAGGPVVISAIAGAPGIGKTALALHWAHRRRDRFGDGDLYVNLRGYDPGPRVEPADVLGDFLLALDVPPARIPTGIEAQAALYRTMLDGRRMLIVLDNAANAEQVRPLLPGSPGCHVLVTSRSDLSGLATRQGARRILLGLMTPVEAIRLLSQIVGADRVDLDPLAAARLVELSGYLPLALRIIAEHVATHPYTVLADLLDELANERRHLDVFTTHDDEQVAVRAAFSWSYRALRPENARMFRLMSVHPTAEFSTAAAAAVAGITVDEARGLLESLRYVHLLEEVSRGRYRFHDLLRAYAAEQIEDQSEEQGGAERDAAIRRMLSWYLHTADQANRTLQPQRRTIPTDPLEPGCQPLVFGSHDEALEWCDDERANLVAATELAAGHGLHTVAWQLPVVLWSFFRLRQHWDEWITTHEVGIECARRVGDRHGEAWAQNSLGNAHRERRQYDAAIACGTRALALRREIGDRYGQGTSLNNLSRAYCALGRYGEAVDHSRQALAIHREIGDRWNEGIDLDDLGRALSELGRYDEAIECWEQALLIHRQIGDRFGESMSMDNLGRAYRGLRQWKDAINVYQQALAIRREIGHRNGEAETLTNLGHTLAAISLDGPARERWSEAEAIFRQIGDPDAADACARLAGRQSD